MTGFGQSRAPELPVESDLRKTPVEQAAMAPQQAALKVSKHPSADLDMASGPSMPAQNADRPLPAVFLATEGAFYSQYSWCLNAFPTIREVVEHLVRQFSLLDSEKKGWQQREVITNIFLFSCAITDTVDDYLVGKTYDFSKVSQALPFSSPGVRVLEKLVGFWGRSREAWLLPLRRWRGVWTKAVTEFLRESLVAEPVPTILLKQRDHLASLLPPPFPLGLWNLRPNVPAFFRSRDFAPSDGLELARKFLVEFPELERPAVLIGLRTAGSFLAPLACAYLSRELQETSWVTMRPGKGLASWEQRALRGAARNKARALIVDESIHSGQTLAKAIDLLRRVGFPEEDIVVLNPVEPALPDWKSSQIFQAFSRIRVITLEPVERYKQRLLESERAVEARLDEYFRARRYLGAQVVPSLEVEEWNREWRTEPPERVDIRLKRVYKVQLKDAAGVSELRYVVAKSVGWGWLGYHAFIAGQLLAGWVPPILGLRDGILYSEWWPQKQHATFFGSNRQTGIELVASYVATRAQNLSLESDPVPDLARAGRHKGLEFLANLLSRAYSSRIVAAMKRSEVQRELSRQNGFVPVMTDSKMSPEEWIVAGGRVMKSDFEHHCFGKNEMGISDPAFDLASAIFHFGLCEAESAHLVRSYVQQSGDQNVAERLFFNKLLASIRAQSMAIRGLQDGRLLSERSAFNQQYISAWNFLVGETVRECGKLCQRPKEIGWHAPLVVADIDGVLDRMVFGFPSTTAAGIQAVSLLHGHGFSMAVNTARTLEEVKEYCHVYGFAGGVAEYGGILWDQTRDRERVLVSAESLEQLNEVRNALGRIPGCFLNDDYRYSLRVFTYQNGRTVPLPALLVQDLLASLKVDRLCAHQTGLDTAIIARETDKGRGLVSLLDFVGLTGTDVLAIGDSEPDLPMFRVARRSFAPGNVTCRREAQLLGCHIADSLYQPGLLEIARRIVHPEGGSCDRCQSIEAGWPKDGNLFVSLLRAADQKPASLLLRNLLNPSLLAAFRK